MPVLRSTPAAVLYADPPWPEAKLSCVPRPELRGLSVEQKSKVYSSRPLGLSQNHYNLMSLSDLKEFKLPKLKSDCFLFLWTPFRRFTMALELMEAWGFRYCNSGFVWVKTTKDGGVRMGMGVRVRMCHELCLLGVRGKPKQLSRSVKSVLIEPYVAHSIKPDKMYDVIEQFSAGPYVELFARRRRPGWIQYGNELPSKEKGDS